MIPRTICKSKKHFANTTGFEYLPNHARFSSLSKFILEVTLFDGKEREHKDNFIIGFEKPREFKSDAQAPELLLQLPGCMEVP